MHIQEFAPNNNKKCCYQNKNQDVKNWNEERKIIIDIIIINNAEYMNIMNI